MGTREAGGGFVARASINADARTTRPERRDCLNNNLNASRPSEHPTQGENVKTLNSY